MITVQNLSKVYGKSESEFIALSDINLVIPDASTVAIIGKSGSGKSTLMHIMSGLDHPNEGKIIIDGSNLHALGRKQMDRFRANEMSFIFQAFFVEGNQTVYQNVSLPLEIAEVPVSSRRKMVENALKQVELSDKINQLARNLSGGQKQRLAIARAIVNKPKIIFADEPTGNLDSITGEKIIDLLFALNKTLGSTLCIVTHDYELASKCQMQVSLKDGNLVSVINNKKLRVKR